MKRIADSLIVAVALAVLTVAGVALVGLGLAHAGAMVAEPVEIRPDYVGNYARPADVRCCRDCGPVCHCDQRLGCHCPRPTD